MYGINIIKTEFNIEIHFNGQMKSGGITKFDASSLLNKDQEGKNLDLSRSKTKITVK